MYPVTNESSAAAGIAVTFEKNGPMSHASPSAMSSGPIRLDGWLQSASTPAAARTGPGATASSAYAGAIDAPKKYANRSCIGPYAGTAMDVATTTDKQPMMRPRLSEYARDSLGTRGSRGWRSTALSLTG